MSVAEQITRTISNDVLEIAEGLMESYMMMLQSNAKRLAPVRKVLAGEKASRRRMGWRAISPPGGEPFYPSGWDVRQMPDFTNRVGKAGRGPKRTWYVQAPKEDRRKSTRAERTRRNTLRRQLDIRFGVNKAAPGSVLLGERRGTRIYASEELYGALTTEGRREARLGAASYLADRAAGGDMAGRRDERGRENRGSSIIPVPVGGERYGHTSIGYGEPGSTFHRGGPYRPSSYKLQIGGRLRRSIIYEVRTEGDKVIGTLRATAPYARYVEYGTTKHGKAQPFMRPTLAMAYRQMQPWFRKEIYKQMLRQR